MKTLFQSSTLYAQNWCEKRGKSTDTSLRQSLVFFVFICQLRIMSKAIHDFLPTFSDKLMYLVHKLWNFVEMNGNSVIENCLSKYLKSFLGFVVFIFLFQGKQIPFKKGKTFSKEFTTTLTKSRMRRKRPSFFLGSKTWSRNYQNFLSFQAKIWQQFLDMPIDMKVLVCSHHKDYIKVSVEKGPK